MMPCRGQGDTLLPSNDPHHDSWAARWAACHGSWCRCSPPPTPLTSPPPPRPPRRDKLDVRAALPSGWNVIKMHEAQADEMITLGAILGQEDTQVGALAQAHGEDAQVGAQAQARGEGEGPWVISPWEHIYATHKTLLHLHL